MTLAERMKADTGIRRRCWHCSLPLALHVNGQCPITSPFVRRALAHELPAKEYGR